MATVQSTRFGAFEVADGRLLAFPRGMVGFSGSRRYALVAKAPEDPFYWLHSADEAGLAFPVADPWSFHPDFELEIDDEELELLGTDDREKLAVFAVVAIGGDPSAATINLLAPVIVNVERALGVQIVNRLAGDPRAPLFGALAGAGYTPPQARASAVTVLASR